MVLGSASQTPTRHRNHNGYLLRWDDRSVLFDPGEGTQRQLLLAGASATGIHHICVTHFHGDHCLGLPGVLQRLSLDRVAHPVEVLFPASGSVYFDRLRHASAYQDHLDVRPVPVADDGPVTTVDPASPSRPSASTTTPRPSAGGSSNPTESGCSPIGLPQRASADPTSGGWPTTGSSSTTAADRPRPR